MYSGKKLKPKSFHANGLEQPHSDHTSNQGGAWKKGKAGSWPGYKGAARGVKRKFEANSNKSEISAMGGNQVANLNENKKKRKRKGPRKEVGTTYSPQVEKQNNSISKNMPRPGNTIRENKPNALQGNKPNALQGNKPNALQGNKPNALRGNKPNALQGNKPNALQGNKPNALQGNKPNAKPRPKGLKNKDWKMLHLHKNKKKSFKELPSKVGNISAAKTGPTTKKERRRLKFLKKGKPEVFERRQLLIKLWEELRRSDCEKERKAQLLKQMCDILRGRVKEYTYAHDTVRVLECILAEGTKEHKTLIFEELKGDIINLATSKYGKFILKKLLKYGLKSHRNAVMRAFHGKVAKMMKHTEAAEIVETIFNEYANASQRAEFVQEYFGSGFQYFKDSEVRNLKALFEKEPEKQRVVMQNMKTELLKVVEKKVIKHSIVHHLLHQFMLYSDPESKAEVIESVRDALPDILHSRDGAKAAMHCIWSGNAKDRKVIVKSMKQFASKIAMDEHGHLVLLALFDCVDDTRLLDKYIIQELLKNLPELSIHSHGRKPLIFLLNPQDCSFIHPNVRKMLKTGEGNEASKKAPEIRQAELKETVAVPLLDFIMSNLEFSSTLFLAFSLAVLRHTCGLNQNVFQAIAKLAAVPYSVTDEDSRYIEREYSGLMVSKLVKLDRSEGRENHDSFTEILMEAATKHTLRSWLRCNRGCFLLTVLLESKIPSVVMRLREVFHDLDSYVEKKQIEASKCLVMFQEKMRELEKAE